MANQAEGADVLKIALASAFRDGKNVIRVPQRFAVDPFQAPALQQFQPVDPARSLQVHVCGEGVGVAQGASPSIP